MNTLIRLIKGELTRLLKYKILPVSLATSVLWIGLFLSVSARGGLGSGFAGNIC